MTSVAMSATSRHLPMGECATAGGCQLPVLSGDLPPAILTVRPLATVRRRG